MYVWQVWQANKKREGRDNDQHGLTHKSTLKNKGLEESKAKFGMWHPRQDKERVWPATRATWKHARARN